MQQEDPIVVEAEEPDGLQFRLLGPLEVTTAGDRLDLGGLRQSRLLALLLLNRQQPTSVARIVDVLWETPPESARQQVHNSIRGIRRALSVVPGTEIITSEAGYRLDVPDESIDVARFESSVGRAEDLELQGRLEPAADTLRRALAYWRGAALAGLDSPYLQSVAGRLEEQRVVAIERLVSIRLRLGDASRLVVELLALVEEHPLRESFRRNLMLALGLLGRQAEALAVYEDARRFLAAELGLDPSPEFGELHVRILRGDPLDVPPAPVAGPAESATEAPALPSRCFLPRDTSEFTGRGEEISQLLTGIRDSPSSALVISAIDGMGGLGKTTLAVHLAHRLTDEFPDGQLFVDLHGFSIGRDSVPPGQALEDLLRQSGVPIELIPSDLLAKEELWRSRLAGRRALVLIDNAKDEAHVRPLIPGSSETLVLVTSRRKLAALEGTVPLSLDVLPRRDAIELFRQVARRPDVTDDSVLGDVVDLCGRLPLAIRIAAARFRDRRHWRLDELLAQLRTHKRRSRFLRVGDRNVLAVLSLSYQYLSKAEKRMFRLLSLHPGPEFDAPAAAALCGIPLDDAEDCLEALYEHSLVVAASGGRYQFHDLVRDCSTELAQQHDSEVHRQAAVHRVLDYFLYMAHSVCQSSALEPLKFDLSLVHVPDLRIPSAQSDGYGLLESNYPGLRAACRLAVEQEWTPHLWQLPCALVPFLSHMNYGPDVFALFQASRSAARSTGDTHGEVASLSAMARIARDYDSAKGSAAELYREAIQLSHGHDDWRLLLSINLAMALGEGGRYQEAQDIYTEMGQLASRLGRTQELIAVRNNHGAVLRAMGRLDEALEQFDHLEALPGDDMPPRAKAAVAYNRGSLFHLMGRPEAALSATLRSFEISETHALRPNATAALAVLSEIHRSRGEFDNALGTGRDALTRAREMHLVEHESMSLNALGEVYTSMRDLRSAKAVYTEALKLTETYRENKQNARALEGLAHVCLAEGDIAAARRTWERMRMEHPQMATSAEGARIHLDDLTSEDVQCLRCRVFQ
ncbi:BTAD domain-containing putative transcriptional regulator [Phytomonospora sp. NPDC050363]|uniref:AfsR/SARP family transcriptional regulator n=1 Tax=Phytomonospora sp. NPDC050363 TaxID=3155642 RepID=UPI00340B2BC8